MRRLWPFFEQFAGGGAALLDYEPVWLRCLDAVYDAVVGLHLPGIAADSIIKTELPLADRLYGGSLESYPGVMICPFPNETTNVTAGPNDRDEISYPICVSVVDKGSSATGSGAMLTSRTHMRRHMLWREKLSRRFRHFQCADIPEIRDVYVRPDAYALPTAYIGNDLYHGAIIIDFVSWETRDNL